MHRLPTAIRVPLVALIIVLSTALHAAALFAVALVKALVPLERVRRACNRPLTGIAESWIGVNSWLIERFTRTRFDIRVDADLRRHGRYLVLANHQGWSDIPVLQKVFNRRIPLLRFFLKRQLFWVPVLGLAWWALDFPFMRRHSREAIARRPELAGQDIEATRRACARFRHIPVAVMNFVEGTRFTAAKHAAQGSPCRHLLRPRAGGVAFVLDAMGDVLEAILDVTVVYPAGRPSVVDLVAGRVPEVRVEVRERPIPREFIGGDYQGDAEFRARFQAWLNALWAEKDAHIASVLRVP
ncbi:MAG: acyltransferase [Xanthomonadales bacterium]|nr:acyltransferase [Xanthomonadales bacterium]